MAEVAARRVWFHRTMFVVVFLVLMLLALLPLTEYRSVTLNLLGLNLSIPPGSWAPPDFLLAVTCAWVVRRPDFVPVWVVAGMFLLADLIFLRPPGLWAACVVAGTEFLRSRAGGLRASNFTAEWLTVAILIIVVVVGYRMLLLAAVTPPPPLHLVLIQMVLTVAIYPVVAGLSHLFFGVRRVAPGEVDRLGHRL